MRLFTNCHIFHCSRERPKNNIPEGYIATHLSITEKPKYPIISRNVDICHKGYCKFFTRCGAIETTKPARIEK